MQKNSITPAKEVKSDDHSKRLCLPAKLCIKKIKAWRFALQWSSNHKTKPFLCLVSKVFKFQHELETTQEIDSLF